MRTRSPGELRLETLNAWNFHAQGYIFLLTRVLDLRAFGQLKKKKKKKRVCVRHPRQPHTHGVLYLMRALIAVNTM